MPKRERINLTGQRFGRWTVLHYSHNNKSSDPIFRCRCDCGDERGVRSDYLRQGRSVSCGCFRGISNQTRPKGKGPPNKLPAGEADKQRILRRYAKRARDKDLPWELTFDEFVNLISGHCSYCGAPPAADRNQGDLNGMFPSNGIDRIDNSLGYTTANCVTACGMCNKAKHTNTPRRIRSMDTSRTCDDSCLGCPNLAIASRITFSLNITRVV